jgi:hypothetical protein
MTAALWLTDGGFTGSYRQLIWKRYEDVDGTQGWQIYLDDNSNNIYVIRWYNNAGMVVGGASTVSQWMQFVYVYDGAYIRTYLNGEVLGTPLADVTSNKTSGNLLINTDFGPFGGLFGEAMIYNRAMSQSEVRTLFASTRWRYK